MERQVLTAPFQPKIGRRVPCGMSISHQFHFNSTKTTVLRVVVMGWCFLGKQMRGAWGERREADPMGADSSMKRYGSFPANFPGLLPCARGYTGCWGCRGNEDVGLASDCS